MTDAPLDHVVSPSDAFPTPLDAITALMCAKRARWEYITFEAGDGRDRKVIEVHDDEIRTVDEPIALASILQRAGLSSLARKVVVSTNNGGDRRFNQLPGASADDLARAVHAIFQHHFGLGETYPVEGFHQD